MVIRTSLLFLFLFLFILFSIARASNDCPIAHCDVDGPIIQFPFWLQGAQISQNCAPSGFNLSCNGQKYPILHIPNSGNFYVKSVYYYIRRISLQDVEGCLMKRLLSLNLLSTPFMAVKYRNYTFFSCPKGEVVFSTGLVQCADLNKTFDVFAVDDVEYRGSRFSDCGEIASIPVPVSYSLFPVDLDLTWTAPRNPKTGRNKRSNLILRLVLTIPVLFILLMFAGCECMKKRGSHSSSSSSVQISHHEVGSLTTSRGLDKSIVETYEKITVEESLAQGPEGVTCTICLADYARNDTIRFMPKCEHYFHVECIDEWLSISTNCPICRISLPNTAN